MSQPSTFHSLKLRAESAEAINDAMALFPLIAQMLRQLSEIHLPHPGNEDLRHGCERALTRILSELARIETAPLGVLSEAETKARNWLADDREHEFVDADILQRIQIFIDFILTPHAPN